MSPLLIVIILGIVEGLTEFLPVSSTGHLILVGDLLNFNDGRGKTFSVFIQCGAILAVLMLYPKRFCRAADIKKMAVASVPVFLLGPLVHGWIKQHLFNPPNVAVALLVGGFIMIWIDRRQRPAVTPDLDQVTMKQAALVGLVQCLSLWPGVSRSASSIIGGMLVGLERRTAAEFSFIIAVPALCGASAYELMKSWSMLSVADIPLFAAGTVVSFIVAAASIKFMMRVLGAWGFVPFGVYRVVLGAIVLAVL